MQTPAEVEALRTDKARHSAEVRQSAGPSGEILPRGPPERLAYPLLEGLAAIGVGTTTGYALIKSGELQTYLVGRYRYITAVELRRFIQARIEEASNENAEDRAKRAAPAVKGLRRQRDEQRAA